MAITHSEQETLILLNAADIRAGYFIFSTTRACDFAKLCRRVGGEGNLLDVRISSQGKRILGWEAKVPVRYLSKRTFAIRRPKGGAGFGRGKKEAGEGSVSDGGGTIVGGGAQAASISVCGAGDIDSDVFSQAIEGGYPGGDE